MSLENVRHHWKSLLKIVLIFLTVIVVGPIVFLGIGGMLFSVTEGLGSGRIVVVGLGMSLIALGWLFFVLWIANRGAESTEEESNG